MAIHPRNANLPPLPPEIWICIFHHATYVPGTLTPDNYSAHASIIDRRACNSDLRDALITKRALVRVCKKWWQLAISFLYQSVYIGLARCLSSLLSALVDSAASKGTVVSALPLGEYTQRLDIAIRDHVVNQDDSASLAAVIKRMPHLTIVSFTSATNTTRSADFPNNILDALHYSAASLRVLDWSTTQHEPSTSRIVNLLAKCTQLRILNYPRLLWSKEEGQGGFPALPPTLSTLCLHAIIPLQTATEGERCWHQLPPPTPGPTSLQELILDLHEDPRHWRDLLRVYSSQLVSVQFRILPSNLGPPKVEDHMKLLAQTCPSLRRLTITSGLFSSFAHLDLIFPSITYLSLRAIRSQSKMVDFGMLFMFLEKLRSGLPSLKVVQLLNESNLRCLLNTHTKFAVRALQPFIEAAPFRIEDKEGVLLTDRLRALGHL